MASVSAEQIAEVLSTMTDEEKGADGLDLFTEALEDIRNDLRRERKWFQARLVSRALRKRGAVEAVFAHTISVGAAEFASQGRTAEFGDGEFLKWLIEWFSDGGWEIIIEFIKALIPLFGGIIGAFFMMIMLSL